MPRPWVEQAGYCKIIDRAAIGALDTAPRSNATRAENRVNSSCNGLCASARLIGSAQIGGDRHNAM
jgi:hypothetical protein